jgi:hypothetical protein
LVAAYWLVNSRLDGLGGATMDCTGADGGIVCGAAKARDAEGGEPVGGKAGCAAAGDDTTGWLAAGGGIVSPGGTLVNGTDAGVNDVGETEVGGIAIVEAGAFPPPEYEPGPPMADASGGASRHTGGNGTVCRTPGSDSPGHDWASIREAVPSTPTRQITTP